MDAPFKAANGGFLAITVPDVSASVEWYSQKLGLKTLKRATSPDKKAEVAVLQANGLTVELVWFADAVSLGSIAPQLKGTHQVHGIFKAGIFVEDLDRVWQEMKGGNVSIAFEPFFDSSMQCRMFAIRDNNGNILQFFGS